MKKTLIVLIIFLQTCFYLFAQPTNKKYRMPEESEPHEGTWLQWPQPYQHGDEYVKEIEKTWIEITKELISSETVHIIAYDDYEKKRIIDLLNNSNISLKNIDFNIYKTDDVWIRDNGPIFVKDEKENLFIEDWGFNGWGEKYNFNNCDKIPTYISTDKKIPLINLNDIMINEGGSVEIDGYGTLMACKSSILSQKRKAIRNKNMDIATIENIFNKYLGVSNFIWLDGQTGLDITDQHIDGFARFGNSNTIVTMEKNDLLDYDVLSSDIEKLYSAKNKSGKPYNYLKLPLTQKNVVTTYGKNLGYKGSYCNFYIANTKILVPFYNDQNDKIALEKIQSLYHTKKAVGIDIRNLYLYGGMIHCITQQQPK